MEFDVSLLLLHHELDADVFKVWRSCPHTVKAILCSFAVPQVRHWGSAAWKGEVERLIVYAAVLGRVAVLPDIACEGYSDRGWQEREVVLSDVRRLLVIYSLIHA